MRKEINCSHPHAFFFFFLNMYLFIFLSSPYNPQRSWCQTKLVFTKRATLSWCCCLQQVHVKEIRIGAEKAPPTPGHPCQLSSQTFDHALLQGGIIRRLCAAEMQPVFNQWTSIGFSPETETTGLPPSKKVQVISICYILCTNLTKGKQRTQGSTEHGLCTYFCRLTPPVTQHNQKTSPLSKI